MEGGFCCGVQLTFNFFLINIPAPFNVAMLQVNQLFCRLHEDAVLHLYNSISN